MAAILVMLPVSIEASTRDSQSPSEAPIETAGQAKTAGILTDRLRGSRLRMWNSIQAVVFATDNSGRLKHPTLNALWHEADRCGHVIHIELSKQECNRAGQVRIERSDSNDRKHVVAIELNLYAIKHASVAEIARQPNGWVPFAGLGLQERCAEVLGHELAHAIRIFRNPEYLQLFRDMERAGREFKWLAPEANERLRRLVQLLSEFEKPVEATEMAVWRELQVR